MNSADEQHWARHVREALRWVPVTEQGPAWPERTVRCLEHLPRDRLLSSVLVRSPAALAPKKGAQGWSILAALAWAQCKNGPIIGARADRAAVSRHFILREWLKDSWAQDDPRWDQLFVPGPGPLSTRQAFDWLNGQDGAVTDPVQRKTLSLFTRSLMRVDVPRLLSEKQIRESDLDRPITHTSDFPVTLRGLLALTTVQRFSEEFLHTQVRYRSDRNYLSVASLDVLSKDIKNLWEPMLGAAFLLAPRLGERRHRFAVFLRNWLWPERFIPDDPALKTNGAKDTWKTWRKNALALAQEKPLKERLVHLVDLYRRMGVEPELHLAEAVIKNSKAWIRDRPHATSLKNYARQTVLNFHSETTLQLWNRMGDPEYIPLWDETGWFDTLPACAEKIIPQLQAPSSPEHEVLLRTLRAIEAVHGAEKEADQAEENWRTFDQVLRDRVYTWSSIWPLQPERANDRLRWALGLSYWDPVANEQAYTPVTQMLIELVDQLQQACPDWVMPEDLSQDLLRVLRQDSNDHLAQYWQKLIKENKCAAEQAPPAWLKRIGVPVEERDVQMWQKRLVLRAPDYRPEIEAQCRAWSVNYGGLRGPKRSLTRLRS